MFSKIQFYRRKISDAESNGVKKSNILFLFFTYEVAKSAVQDTGQVDGRSKTVYYYALRLGKIFTDCTDKLKLRGMKL